MISLLYIEWKEKKKKTAYFFVQLAIILKLNFILVKAHAIMVIAKNFPDAVVLTE